MCLYSYYSSIAACWGEGQFAGKLKDDCGWACQENTVHPARQEDDPLTWGTEGLNIFDAMIMFIMKSSVIRGLDMKWGTFTRDPFHVRLARPQVWTRLASKVQGGGCDTFSLVPTQTVRFKNDLNPFWI